MSKNELLDDIKSDLHKVQKRLKKVKKISTKIQALREEDELIQRLMRIENNEISHEVAENEKFDMNELELI